MPQKEYYDGTQWVTESNGTVTKVTAGVGLDGGEITSEGTISLSSDIKAPGNLTINNGYLVIPVGTTADRPEDPVIGMVRINTDLD